VLLVDDESDILDILSETVELERCRTITAESVEKALEHLESYKVDLVISDILIPGMDGFELLAHIKENHPGIPVILITGYSGQYTPVKAMAAGAVRYLKKPFENTELVYALRSALESRSSSCQINLTSGKTN
jgi:DNA-binding NtrC family response regulator